MPVANPSNWFDEARGSLERYDEDLLRRVSGRLFKPRNQWPADELIERCLEAALNPVIVDRKLQALDPAGRRLLAVVAHSRQMRWKVGQLRQLAAALGDARETDIVLSLLEEGLLYPAALEPRPSLKKFESWLDRGGASELTVFTMPEVAARALGADLGLPSCPGTVRSAEKAQEADGLEWPLRLVALWQQAAASPLRLTQGGEFFKKDLERLQSDALLSAGTGDINAGLVAVRLARAQGILQATESELRAGAFPQAWREGLCDTLASLYEALATISWTDPAPGGNGTTPVIDPYPTAFLLALLLLTRLETDEWARVTEVEQWVLRQHPHWGQRAARAARTALADSLETNPVQYFLAGPAYHMRLVELGDGDGKGRLARLSATGRWLLGLAERPPSYAAYPKTLLVQPNLEVVVYRQGLTPALVAALSEIAVWKTLGAACTLQLQPESVYRALESGWTPDTILRLLEQHGMRPTPPAVVESVRTWAGKRERLSVYPSAALFEFVSAEDLDWALARGLPGERLTERIAVVPNEKDIDYRHFRLSGTRDYGLPPDQCVEIEPDGITLTIDPARADLLLDTEMQRFALPLAKLNADGRRQYQVTLESLAAARAAGLGLQTLEEWFRQRTGRRAPPAVRLLLSGPHIPVPQLRQLLVLVVETSDVADGLEQWPGTQPLIEWRLGPTALAVRADRVDELAQKLNLLGIRFQV
jgi:hypothetical protein